ncbi:MAG: DUF3533 domain-containing protein [Solirubrobacteraceae bacterium]
MPKRVSNRFIEELRDAVTGRAAELVAGVLVIQLAFVFSYVGAFHRPTPHHVPVQVVAPPRLAVAETQALNALAGGPLKATAATDQGAALRRLRENATDAVLVLEPRSRADTLYVAGGGGAALVTAVQDVLGRVEAAQRRGLRTVDAVPAQSGDARGLSGFYLVVGWLIGGYLAASLLAISHGSRPANQRRAVIRLLALALYAVISGVGGALIVGPLLGALTGHVLALWWVGALLVFAAAAVTMALQVLVGVVGIGLTVVLFVVLGNPSAGGAYPAPLLPGFWRAISSWLPNGAGVEVVRRIVYFGGHGIGGALVVIAGYALVGTLLALAVTRIRLFSRPTAA